MLPSDSLQNFTPPQSTTNAESAPDVVAEKKKLLKEVMNSSLTSMEPKNSSEQASYSRSTDDDISSCTRKRMEEKRRKEKLQEKYNEKVKEVKAKVNYGIETQDKDDIGGEFSLFPCCKEIDNPEELFEHIKKHHDKDATQCALCGKELSSKSSLDRHLLIHAKWQPYQCCHCNKQFSTNGNMHRHKKTHRGVLKRSKVLKEETSLSEEAISLKKIKKDVVQSKNEETQSSIANAKINVNKRKMRSKLPTTESTISKKIKLELENPNVKQVDQKESVVSATVQMQTDDLDSKMPVISDITRPTKDVFITTLGLRNVCGSEETQQLPVINFKPLTKDESADVRSLTERYPELKKVCPESKEVEYSSEIVKEAIVTEENIEEDDNNNKLVIDLRKEQEDLADISTILSNMKFQHKVVSPLKVKEDSSLESYSCSNTVSNADSYLLFNSKKPRTGTATSTKLSKELTFFVPKKKPQQKLKLVCNQCEKKFGNKHSFRKHMVKHGKPKPFKCDLCGAKLLNKPNAIRHGMKVHNLSRSLAKKIIVYNLERAPSNGFKTICIWCGKDFTSNLILEHHKRSTLGCLSKPYMCLLCNKRFSTKNNGRRHQGMYHKEQIESCIVPNNGVANNSTESVESNNSSNDSSASAATEASNNGSDGNDTTSSNCSDSSLLRESVPSKELAAAQVLLNLSMHTSNNDCIEQLHQQQFENQHVDDDINVVQRKTPIALQNICEPNLSNDAVLQECPLDLTLRPMDLRKKYEKEYPARKCVSEGFLNFQNIYMTPTKEWKHNFSLPGLEIEKECSTDTPLNLVKRDATFTGSSSSFTTDSFTPDYTEPKHLVDLSFSSLHDSPKNRSQNSSSLDDAKLQCDFCSISFANNSNKRRHEKKKHLLHVLDTTPVHLTQEYPEAKRSKSVLSEKTKEAIITKVSHKPIAVAMDCSTNGSTTLSHPLGALSSEAESGDLASVSSLINTANSPQLKKYLTSESNCDVMPSQDLTANKNEIDVVPKPSSQKTNGKKVANKFLCQKCDKEFTCESSFKRHFVTHTKERNFRCSECDKTFTVKSNRDRHLKKIHHMIFTQVGRRNLMPVRAPQKQSDSEVPSEEEPIDVKDLTLPKELLQCNKENQRLFMPS